jgi:mono/diheme cytochrome c family protein
MPTAILLAALVLVPAMVIARVRAVYSTKPRLHLFMDMAVQPKLKPQQTCGLFPDDRAMRLPVADTVAGHEWPRDERFHTGRQGEDWITDFPLPVTEPLMRRGQQRFNIYCSPCHGLDGSGNGMVAVRAAALQEAAWVKPASFHADQVRQRPVGHIFNTISNGIATMPFYASQIPVADRWAIVAYVRALQRSRSGRLDDVPAGVNVDEPPASPGSKPADQ